MTISVPDATRPDLTRPDATPFEKTRTSSEREVDAGHPNSQQPLRRIPASPVNASSAVGEVLCLEDGASVEGDSDFESVGHVGQSVNGHAALKFPGVATVNGELEPSSPIRNVGRRWGRDQLRCVGGAEGGLPSLSASNFRILSVSHEFGRIIGAERGDGQSACRQWVAHRMKCTRWREVRGTADRTRGCFARTLNFHRTHISRAGG